jgi:hypothetical protein
MHPMVRIQAPVVKMLAMNEHMDQQPHNPIWHAAETDDVLAFLNVDKHGLSPEEARRRLEAHGPNKLSEEHKPGMLQRFARQFKNVLIYILLAAAALTALLGEWIDMGVILAVVVINALIGFIQEGKAEKAMEAIRGMLSPKATVVRDGESGRCRRRSWCPGISCCCAQATACRRTADAARRNAQAEEAALTGRVGAGGQAGRARWKKVLLLATVRAWPIPAR